MMRRADILTVCMAVALVFVASCNIKEEPVKDFITPESGTVITAVADQIGVVTKVEMAYCYNALWQTGDQIHVKQGQTTDTFSLVGGEGTTKGTFKGTKSISGEIEAFYPVSVGETMKWPSEQTNTQAVPMYAHHSITGAENETVNFTSLGAVLQIVLTTSENNLALSKIKLYDDAKPMSGEFEVENGRAVITSTDKSGITLDIEGTSIGRAAKYFNIAVPAGKYEDLHLDFVLADGRIYNMVFTTMPEIEHNSVAKIALYLDVSHMPTGISLSYKNLNLIPGDEYSLLKPTILPADAENKNVIWTSSDESVVTVDEDGKITAVALGNATITATAKFSRLSASCEVTVQELPFGALSGKFSVSKTKRVYFSKGNMWKGSKDYLKYIPDGYYIEHGQNGSQPTRDSLWRKDHISHFYYSADPEVVYLDRYFGGTISKAGDVFFTNETEDTPNPNFSVNAGGIEWKGVWRVLSDSEWNYLLNEREMTYGKPRYSNWWVGAIFKNGVIDRGLFIYPDDFNSEPLLSDRMYSWEDLNEMGVVVLTVGGIRDRTDVKNKSGATAIACYWTSVSNDKDNTKAVSLKFEEVGFRDAGVKIDSLTDRNIAHTVRLVRDVFE